MIKRLRRYSLDRIDDDPQAVCGRLLEYTWHILFTDNPVMEDRNYTNINTGEVWSTAPEKFCENCSTIPPPGDLFDDQNFNRFNLDPRFVDDFDDNDNDNDDDDDEKFE